MSTAIDSVPALVSGTTILDEIVDARGPWSAIVAAGDVLTIVDLHGWGAAAEQLSQMARRGEWAAMGSVITDPMLEAFAVSGRWADLPALIQSRYAGRLLDRVALYLPYTPGHDDAGWRAVATGLRG